MSLVCLRSKLFLQQPLPLLVVLFSMLITAGYVRGAVDMLQLPFFSLLLFVRSLLVDVVLEIEEQRNLFMDPYVDILDLFFLASYFTLVNILRQLYPPHHEHNASMLN